MWRQATDRMRGMLSLAYGSIIVFTRASSFCVCVGASFCCYDDTTGHNSSADAANSPTPSPEPSAAPAVTAATTSTDVTAGILALVLLYPKYCFYYSDFIRI